MFTPQPQVMYSVNTLYFHDVDVATRYAQRYGFLRIAVLVNGEFDTFQEV